MSATSGGSSEGGRRLGMMGGTFDPPHNAHLALADAARRTLDLDRVVFVPAGDPWRKRGREITPAAVRLDLVRAAVEELAWAEVSAIEVEREGASYTHETLAGLIEPGESWWFIMGSDALADMPHWRDPGRILALARLAVARRPDAPQPQLSDEIRRALPGVEERMDFVEMPQIDLSSTDIRERLRSGESVEGLVPDTVRTLIERLALYR